MQICIIKGAACPLVPTDMLAHCSDAPTHPRVRPRNMPDSSSCGWAQSAMPGAEHRVMLLTTTGLQSHAGEMRWQLKGAMRPQALKWCAIAAANSWRTACISQAAI